MRPNYSDFNYRELELSMIGEHRQFQRIPFDAHIKLILDDDLDRPITGTIEDISLKGALIAARKTPSIANVGAVGTLIVHPDQSDIELTFSVEIAYSLPARQAYGLNIKKMDIESAVHLRRLIELNLGDEDSLQRELSNIVTTLEREQS